MKDKRPIHPDFQFFLDFKEKALRDLYVDLRQYILEIHLDANELLYHTHALTSVYSLSEKLSDAFVMLPIYTSHVNLGFNKGTLLDDPHNLLKGTGKLIRHVEVKNKKDYRNKNVKSLVQKAIEQSMTDQKKNLQRISRNVSQKSKEINSMKIAVAQSSSKPDTLNDNINQHLELVGLAIKHDCDLVFFPELSLTSYQAVNAHQVKMKLQDERLDAFQSLSDQGKIIIAIGVPLEGLEGIEIAMLIFQPNMPRTKYSKQLLYKDELPHFIHGDKQIIIEKDGSKIAPAICYESTQDEHLRKAIEEGAQFYLASVAKSDNGIKRTNVYYEEAAKKHGIPILMSNSVGECDTFVSAGQSAIYNSKGQKIGELEAKKVGLLVYDQDNEEVITKQYLAV